MQTYDALRLSLIAAVAENGVIGNQGVMPWKLSTDLRRFKSITTGKPVIMGRKTFESIGRPLPDRVNIVLTRDPGFDAAGTVGVPTVEAAISAAIAAAAASDNVEAVVMGGGEIYALFMERASRLYLTHVLTEPTGDAYFPAVDLTQWEPVSEEAVPPGPKDEFASRFTIYERRAGTFPAVR